jgi:hypothetical protein
MGKGERIGERRWLIAVSHRYNEFWRTSVRARRRIDESTSGLLSSLRR